MTTPTFTDRSSIADYQLEKLQSLLQSVLPRNSFYSEKFKVAGVDVDIQSRRDFSTRVPFTTKQELVDNQKDNPPYGTNLTYPPDQYTRFHQTSASTGTPMRWLDTNEDWDWMLNNWKQVFEAAGATAGDRVFFAFSFGPFLGFWTAFESAAQMNLMCIPGGGLSTSARLKMIVDNEVDVLCCTPTYAIRMAHMAAEEGISLQAVKVRKIIVAGEPGGSIPATRSYIESLWPTAEVFDHHGMTEVGPVTFECPKQPGVLHIMEDAYLAEIIDPQTGEAIDIYSTDASGELVLTTLGRQGSPLIRYRTGDWVRPLVEDPCSCGRFDMGLRGGILGRTDDMVVVRGVNIFPGAVEEIIRSIPAITEYRVTIDASLSLAEMKLEIEVKDNEDGVKERLERDLRDSLSLRVPVKTVESGTLPTFEMKAKRWVKI